MFLRIMLLIFIVPRSSVLEPRLEKEEEEQEEKKSQGSTCLPRPGLRYLATTPMDAMHVMPRVVL
jgi:hypothetical protein